MSWQIPWSKDWFGYRNAGPSYRYFLFNKCYVHWKRTGGKRLLSMLYLLERKAGDFKSPRAFSSAAFTGSKFTGFLFFFWTLGMVETLKVKRQKFRWSRLTASSTCCAIWNGHGMLSSPGGESLEHIALSRFLDSSPNEEGAVCPETRYVNSSIFGNIIVQYKILGRAASKICQWK